MSLEFYIYFSFLLNFLEPVVGLLLNLLWHNNGYCLQKNPIIVIFYLMLPKTCVCCLLLTDTKIHPVIAKLLWRSDPYINRICCHLPLLICFSSMSLLYSVWHIILTGDNSSPHSSKWNFWVYKWQTKIIHNIISISIANTWVAVSIFIFCKYGESPRTFITPISHNKGEDV